ncbi:protein TIC 22, chloroplastic-like [Curcuma longa]|uniref:protein TIC 22, chloroplastic-like n=1 Tax=Curcuma longa TaxID=136217 RepID=UPI003D9DEF77
MGEKGAAAHVVRALSHLLYLLSLLTGFIASIASCQFFNQLFAIPGGSPRIRCECHREMHGTLLNLGRIRPNPDGGHLVVAVVVAVGADELRPSGRSRHHVSRLSSEFSSRAERSRCLVLAAASPRLSLPPFAAAYLGSETAPSPAQGKHNFDLALIADYVAKTLAGTSVYTVSNSNDEFVLISDPSNSFRSLGIFCFRKEDAQTLLAQVKLRQPILGRGAKVVPIVLDQVYMLKVEGIAFRFLPDPLQIKNALTACSFICFLHQLIS